MRKLLLLALLGAAVLPAAAGAKSYVLPRAEITVTVAADSSLLVEEKIHFAFSGDFSGAYRDIPLRPGESIDRISVREDTRAQQYRPGASAELGSSGAPDTFGVARLPDGMRVVWHYRAVNESRIFTVAYRLRGLAVAYDDVVDVNLQVWGDEWPVGVTTLEASVVLPGAAAGPRYRVWGHPQSVQGTVERNPQAAELQALFVPPGQFVELRVVFPRRLVDSTVGARVVPGNGLGAIVAEEQAAVDAYEHGRRKVRDALDHLPRTIAYLLLLAVGPALAVIILVWLVYGREPRTRYDREYEQAPPSDLPPALVPALLHERKSAVNVALAFTATLFDLIQRGRYASTPVTSEERRWRGERTESVADLELSQGKLDGELGDLEQPVSEVIDDVLEDGPVLLTGVQGRIARERKENARRFVNFQSRISKEIRERKWYVPGSGGKIMGLSIPAFIVAGVVLLVVGVVGRPADRLRTRLLPQRAGPGRRGLQRPALAEAHQADAARGRALGRVPPLSHGLPPARGCSTGHARALGALPRLRDRVRHRQQGAGGGALPHAAGAARPERHLLDLRQRQPGLGSERARHREARRRVRLGVHASGLAVVVELELQLLGLRRQLLGRRRRRWRRRWRRRVVRGRQACRRWCS